MPSLSCGVSPSGVLSTFRRICSLLPRLDSPVGLMRERLFWQRYFNPRATPRDLRSQTCVMCLIGILLTWRDISPD